ncbi:hypothetical protein MLD38_028739 [Melastoma candidum]|uniref:Uncharacterized protein n=1 Tax=Melastoma candidum TaxID=119954 RepID=A0ACB9N1V6_9MYRT|nr:hypothetical protein MLD38_028739 [Melastoma candidum]
MDLFPQGVGYGSDKGDVPNSLLDADNTSDGPRKAMAAPMTIFYAGQVLVFNYFPADKVKEVMLLAGRSILLRFLPITRVQHTHLDMCLEREFIMLTIYILHV